MFNALVHRQDGEIAGATEPPCVDHRLEVSQDLGTAIRRTEDPVDDVRAWEGELLLRYSL